MGIKEIIEEARDILAQIDEEANKLVQVQEDILFNHPSDEEMERYSKILDIRKNIKGML